MNRKKKHQFNDIHIQRLIKFADHLQTANHFCDYPVAYFNEIDDNGFPIRYWSRSDMVLVVFPFIYCELSIVFFDDWKCWAEYGLVFYKLNNKLTNAEAIMQFFGMSSKQFVSCFIPDVHSEYGLHAYSTLKMYQELFI